MPQSIGDSCSPAPSTQPYTHEVNTKELDAGGAHSPHLKDWTDAAEGEIVSEGKRNLVPNSPQ